MPVGTCSDDGSISELRLAVVTPVLTMMPGAHARWEESGTIEDVARIAEAADGLGYDESRAASTLRSHRLRRSVAVGPTGILSVPSDTSPPARRTSASPPNVLVLGYHHPLEIAKRYGTLDRISGGRLVLGVGVGNVEGGIELLAAPFDDRGDRADDALRALRASLSVTENRAYEGRYYAYPDVVVDPSAIQEHVPIWVGGRTSRSLRRAVQLADGWCPFGVMPHKPAIGCAPANFLLASRCASAPRTRLTPWGSRPWRPTRSACWASRERRSPKRVSCIIRWRTTSSNSKRWRFSGLNSHDAPPQRLRGHADHPCQRGPDGPPTSPSRPTTSSLRRSLPR